MISMHAQRKYVTINHTNLFIPDSTVNYKETEYADKRI